MSEPAWEWAVVAVFAAYCLGAFAQLIHHRRYLRSGATEFPPAEMPVSVIMGIRSGDPRLGEFLRSVCEQDYPDYEVLLLSTAPDEPGASVGAAVAARYPHARHLVARGHDPAVTVGKNHALLAGIAAARHDILVFCDADVVFEPGWLQKMVSPLGRQIEGRTVHAVGAPFFVRPRNRLGRAFSLGSNVITYLASFARPRQVFPAYVSGHSMAVRKDLVEREIAPYWARAFNDDLILAYVLRETGRNLYYRRDAALYPEEDMSSWRALHAKMVRWGITVRRFQHPDMRRETTRGALLNTQFIVGPAIALAFMAAGTPSLALLVLFISWAQVVAFRYVVARRIGERNGAFILLAPACYLFFGAILLHYYLWGKRFRWGPHEYRVDRAFSMVAPRDDDWRSRFLG